MNTKEQAIVEFLLTAIEKACDSERLDAIYTYQSFLSAIQTRLQIEAQTIENKKQLA